MTVPIVHQQAAAKASGAGGTTISVVIPCYNEEEYIGRCLESLLAQTMKPAEVIVVDDGSTDRTLGIIRTYPVRLMQQNHGGPGGARNLGASEATGNILVFVDADMTFDGRYLETLTAPIRNGEATGTFHKEEYVANTGNWWATCWNYEVVGCRDRRIPPDHPNDSTIYRAILRSVFLGVGGFDPALGYEDDATLYTRLGEKARYAPGAICYHNNPGSCAEVYASARWMGRGSRFSSKIRRLVKFTLPWTICRGIYKSFAYGIPGFLIFKFVFDFGILSGGLSRMIFQQHSK